MRRAIWIAILVVLFSSCGKPTLKETLKSRQSQSKPAQTQETPKEKTKSGLVIYETKVENIEQAVRKTLYDLNDNVYLIEMEYLPNYEGSGSLGYYFYEGPVYCLFDFSGFVGMIKCQWAGWFKKYENIFVADKKFFFTFKTEENASKKLLCVKADLETGKTRFVEPDTIPKNASKVEPKYLGMNQESATNAHRIRSQYSGDEIERRTGIKQPEKTGDYNTRFVYAFDSNGYIFVVKGTGTDGGALWGVACNYLGVFKEKTWEKVFESSLGNDFWLFGSMMIFQSWSEGAKKSSNFVDLTTGKVIPGYSDIDVILPIDRKLIMFATENGVRKLVALNIDKLDELRNQ